MNRGGVILLITILYSVLLWSQKSTPTSQVKQLPDTFQMQKAISVAVTELQKNSVSPQDFVLIDMQWLSVQGKYVWQATFKPKNLLPTDLTTEPIGKGGEIFICIDLKDGSAKITYGE